MNHSEAWDLHVELRKLLQEGDIHNGPYTDTVTIIIPGQPALATALMDKLKELKED